VEKDRRMKLLRSVGMILMFYLGIVAYRYWVLGK
jgi:hypothetical protein